MGNFTCSNHTRHIGEEIIGTASNYQTYILVECPPPWTSETFKSKWIPDNLRVLVQDIQNSHLSIRFLLIARDQSSETNQTTLLIYQQQQGLSRGYDHREFHLPNIELAAGMICQYLSEHLSGNLCRSILDYEVRDYTTKPTRDILICTHGAHDQCCSRYGNPFYFYAQKTISDLKLDHVRLWKSTHFGGHRFAPTAIDLPQGRYYGLLDQNSLRSLLTKTGDMQYFNQIYRGWGILPPVLQIWEREFIRRYGWDWFNYQVSGKILEQSLDNKTILAELSFVPSPEYLYTYKAKLVEDRAKTLTIKTSCNSTQETSVVKYAIDDFWLDSRKVLRYSNSQCEF